MSVKKTQDFLYFQNKASHYHNIVKAKSKLDDKIHQSLLHTVDYHHVKNTKKHQPHLRQFQIKYNNQTMLKRILSKQKSPLNKHSTYSRYNSFQRGFRHLNPHKSEQQRLIQIQNNKLRKSIQKAKANVGSIQDWRKDYHQNVKLSRLRSKFEGLKAKDELTIQTEKFLPERYLRYLEHAQIQNEEQALNSQLKPKLKKNINIDKLFLLPNLQSPTSRLQSSPSFTGLSSAKKSQTQSRANFCTINQNNPTLINKHSQN